MTAKISHDTYVDGVQHCAAARSDTAPALALLVRFAADLAAGARSAISAPIRYWRDVPSEWQR